MSWKVRAQADDFFNAYKVISESNQTAASKLAASAGKPLGGQAVLGAIPVMGVDVVCLAFSVELYIKDIYYALNKKRPHGHNILKLYKDLPQQVKEQIFAHDSISQNPFITRGSIFSPKTSAYDGFLSQIETISDGFIKWRYSYESITLNYDVSFALSLIEAFKSTADSIRAQSK
jgi:hypothetical protein